MINVLSIALLLTFSLSAEAFLDIKDNNNGTYSVLYSSNVPIAGYQFDVDGSIKGATGGDSGDAGFTISSSNSTTIGFSLTGATFGPGDGTMLILAGSDITKLLNVVLSDPSGDPIKLITSRYGEKNSFDGNYLSPQKQKLALIDFEHIGVKKSDARALSKRLTTEIVKIDKYIMVERAAMEKILEEQKFQTASGNVTNDIVDIGNMVGADFIIFGSISKVGSTYSVDSRIINTKTSEVIRSATFDANNLDKLVKRGMKDIAYQLCDVENPKKNNKNSNKKNKGKIEKVSSMPALDQEVSTDDTESWYFYLSYGAVSNYNAVYWDRYSNFLSTLDEYSNKEENDLYFEIGAYWHLTPTSIWGVVIESSTTERVFNSDGIYNPDSEVYESLPFIAWEDDSKAMISISAITYLDKFEKGWFLKGDFGSASLLNYSYFYEYSQSSYDEFSYELTDTYLGLGYNLEIGYSFDLGGTRLVTSLGYSNRTYDFDSREVVDLVVGDYSLSNTEYTSFEEMENDWNVDYDDYHELSHSSFVLKIGFIF